MRLKVLYAHRWQIISPMEADGRSQVEVFMDEVGHSFGANLSGLLGMMERHSRFGSETFNTEQCHYVDQNEKIYEYIKGRLRFFWFEDGDRVVVCTHGIIKKTQKTPKREIAKAIRVKNAYKKNRDSGSITLIEEN